MKKKWLVAILALLVVLAVSYLLIRGVNWEYEAVAVVNGEPIARGEFNLLFSTHNENSKSFDVIKRIKIEQIIMKEYKLVEDISYGAFVKDFKKENLDRKEKVKKKQPIYGPQQYTEQFYYKYLHDNRVIALLEKVEDKFYADDVQIRAYYESKKDEMFKKADYIRVQMVKVAWKSKSDSDALEKNKAEAKIKEAKAAVTQGQDFAEVMSGFNVEKKPLERVFDDSTYKDDTRFEVSLYRSARGLQKGEISEIIEVNDAFVIMKCIERVENQYRSFEESKGLALKRYKEAKYEEYIVSLLEKAEFTILRRP